MADARTNFAYSTVTAAPSPATSGTSLTVAGGTWPAVPFNAVVHAAGASESAIASGAEIVRVTANASGVFTITRASEGPNGARTIVIGDIVKAGVTKKTLDDILGGGPFSALTVNPTASSIVQGLNVTQSGHGTTSASGYYGLNNILVTADDINSGSGPGDSALQIDFTYGGAAAVGNRIGLFGYLKQNAATGNAQGYYLALQGISESSTGDGGTNTAAGAKGSYFGENLQVRSDGATNVYSLTGTEIDIFGKAASSQKYVFGASVCSYHVTQGATLDAAYETHAGGSFSGYGPGGGFGYGLVFAELESNGLPPLSSGASAIALSTTSLSSVSIAKGIDFSKFNFSSDALALSSGASQFTVNSGGKLGIGMAPSGNGVDIKSATAFLPQFMAWNDNNGASGPYFVLRSSRAGSSSQVSDTLGTLIFQGYDSAGTPVVQNSCQIAAVVTAVASGSVTSYLQIIDANLLTNGTIGVTGTRVSKGWFTDLEVTNAPTLSGVAIPSISSTNTLTNKRVSPRTGTTTSSTTPTINTDNVDFYSITAQTADITSFTTNLSGTPTEGQKLWIAITGTAARAITWGTSFESSTVTLPTTTVTTNRLDVGFVWNTVTSKWRCVATA